MEILNREDEMERWAIWKTAWRRWPTEGSLSDGCSVNPRKELYPQSHLSKLNTKAVILLCDLFSRHAVCFCEVWREKGKAQQRTGFMQFGVFTQRVIEIIKFRPPVCLTISWIEKRQVFLCIVEQKGLCACVPSEDKDFAIISAVTHCPTNENTRVCQ